jgi:hypothetical protein
VGFAEQFICEIGIEGLDVDPDHVSSHHRWCRVDTERLHRALTLRPGQKNGDT